MAAERVGVYHRTELRSLLEHVRNGFERRDRGEIDEFELDDLIYQYKRAAKDLWVFCNIAREEQVDHAISAMEERGDRRDWWHDAAPRTPRHRGAAQHR